jgi:hypothetical protein
MANCIACRDALGKSLFAGNREWKSCPKCSSDTAEHDCEHVYYPYPEDFGTTDERASKPNPDGPQSYCIECRERGSRSGKMLRCSFIQAARKGGPKRTVLADPDVAALVGDAPADFPAEGERRLREHIEIERAKGIRRKVLDLKSSRGALACEGCGQDPADKYGPGLSLVLEVHHKIPLARGVQKAEVTDFAVLCPTCHRVVHFGTYEPMPIGDLKALLGR